MGSVRSSKSGRGRVGPLIFIALTLAVPSSGDAQSLADRIGDRLEEAVRTEGIPGLTAAVVKNGEVIYTGAFGVRSVESGEPLTPEHVFHMASVSKPFVATAVVQLVEQDKLSLEDRVTDHLPYFRLGDPRYRDITVRQMLNHTSGMPDVEDYEWGRPQHDDAAAERYVRSLADEPMLWAPGEGYRYSNMAFDVMGDLIAKVSGMSFEAYIDAHILTPLGMRESSFLYPDIRESLRTDGHVGDPARPSGVYPYNRRHAPSSTLNSNVVEMTQWLFVNLGRGRVGDTRILEGASYDLLWTPTVETDQAGRHVGLSWFLGDFEGHRFATHSGGDTGFRSLVVLLPDDDVGLVLSSNWSGTDMSDIGRGLLGLLIRDIEKGDKP